MTDAQQILPAAGVSVPEVDEYAKHTANRDEMRCCLYGEPWFDAPDSVDRELADAALVALAREVAKWKWVAKASVAEHCIYGARTVGGVDDCEVCSSEVARLLARYAEEADHDHA